MVNSQNIHTNPYISYAAPTVLGGQLAPRDPSTTSEKPTVQNLLILAASGDLTSRLLLPGLASLALRGGAQGLNLIGSARNAISDDQWKEQVKETFTEAYKVAQADQKPYLDELVNNATFMEVNPTEKGTKYSTQLADALNKLEGATAVYFALPPAVAQEAVDLLKKKDLPQGTIFALEKPFGTDEQSAKDLNATLQSLLPEKNIFRSDHFLATPAMLNLLALRFSNIIYEPLLNNTYVESIDVIYDEDLTAAGRAGYYDHNGALKDMIQSHLLQVMGLATMNAPAILNADDFRDEIALTIKATKLLGSPDHSARRARYTTGEMSGKPVEAYVDEEGVDPSRKTETLAEMYVEIDNWRWAGVPIRLRSGKALGKARKEIHYNFKAAPAIPVGFSKPPQKDSLIINLNLNGHSHAHLHINASGPRDVFDLSPVTLEAQFDQTSLLPYGEILNGILHSNPMFFVRGDVAVQCWAIVDPVLEAFTQDQIPLDEYIAGSVGPEGWENTDDFARRAPQSKNNVSILTLSSIAIV